MLKKNKRAPLTRPQNNGHLAGHSEMSLPLCPACGMKDREISVLHSNVSILNEQLSFMRNQVIKLQDQVLSFVPNASEQYTRMMMTQQAVNNRDVMTGLVSSNQLVDDVDDIGELDQLHNDILKNYS